MYIYFNFCLSIDCFYFEYDQIKKSSRQVEKNMYGTNFFVLNIDIFEICIFKDERENMTGNNENDQSTEKGDRDRDRSSGETFFKILRVCIEVK